MPAPMGWFGSLCDGQEYIILRNGRRASDAFVLKHLARITLSTGGLETLSRFIAADES